MLHGGRLSDSELRKCFLQAAFAIIVLRYYESVSGAAHCAIVYCDAGKIF